MPFIFCFIIDSNISFHGIGFLKFVGNNFNIPIGADLNNITEISDLGIAVGGEFDFNIYKGKLFIETKYTWELTNLAKDGKYIAKSGHLEIEQQLDSEENKYNSRIFQISVGYAIPL